MSMTDEEYTQDLARRIRPIIEDFYGHTSDEEVAHIVCEALQQAALDVRSGRTAKLEHIGQIRPIAPGHVDYAACPELFTPLRRTA